MDPHPGRHRRAPLRRRRRRRSSRWARGPARKALAEAGLQPDQDIDTVIVATCSLPTSRSRTPPPRSRATLGIHAPGSFDLNAACAGFCYGARDRRPGDPDGQPRTVLVVGSEKLTDWTDPTDRANAIIFADGAGAAVVTAADRARDRPGRLGQRRDPDSRRSDIDAGWHFFQEGQTVFRWATSAIAPVAIRAAEAAGVDAHRHRRHRHPPGEPADHRRDRQEADRGRRAARRQGRAGTSSRPATPPRHPFRWPRPDAGSRRGPFRRPGARGRFRCRPHLRGPGLPLPLTGAVSRHQPRRPPTSGTAPRPAGSV